MVKGDPKEFLETLFHMVWSNLHVPDRESPMDVRDAVEILINASRLTQHELSMRLGVMPNTFHSMQVSCRFKPEVLKRLAIVSTEFEMPMLAAWFDQQAGVQLRRKNKPMAWR